MTYLALNSAFLGIALILPSILLGKRGWLLVLKVALPMLLLTAIFDNAIIAAGLVTYDVTRISQIYIGLAPIEDFGYTIAVALLIPTLWTYAKRDKK